MLHAYQKPLEGNTIGIVFGSIATFTPSKDTLYAMTVANCITEDNIDYITEKGEKEFSS